MVCVLRDIPNPSPKGLRLLASKPGEASAAPWRHEGESLTRPKIAWSLQSSRIEAGMISGCLLKSNGLLGTVEATPPDVHPHLPESFEHGIWFMNRN